ncbi:PREDICTED: uncharacterized protein LOC108553754 [Eufriesea mexicana]|uniref:uncharacterized protein LOC108553754 n=1 Tax=Eufriesea mexicana TaxID=516756 RepID=UPI00083C396F|nr:PREDICTED: uncharacterized protein LOC108553754 [Eufriesea mexicana]
MFTTMIFIFALNALWIVCQAVPLLDLRNTLEQNVLDAMVTSACSSNGDCWEWLPVQEAHENVPTISKNLPISKIHSRRQAESIDPNTVIDTWGNNSPPLNRKVHQSTLTAKQIGNRMSKKDVVMSRSWGAGGMPFSVLYMNLHGSRGNQASTAQQQEVGKAESSTPPIMLPNPRIVLRNGSSTQTRRQYSIIPQLFISYGWGPFGK